MPRACDVRTTDLFEVPTAPSPAAGSLNFDIELRALLSETLRLCQKDRYQVGADMSRLLGREVSRYMLDAYTAESREANNFPLNYAAAFEVATESHALTEFLSRKRGCRLLVGEDAILAELGRIERTKTELAVRERALKDHIRRRRPA